MTTEITTNGQAGQNGALYRLVWRWHFYAALFVAPFAIMLAITGSLYLFRPQIQNVLYAKLYDVKPAATILTADEQLHVVRAKFPDAKVMAYLVPPADTRSALFRIRTADNTQMLAAVDPYSGKVLGTIDENKRLMKTIRELHGKLLGGKAGQAVVELAASWLMVLLVSGLYMWWPRGRHAANALYGTVMPRLRAGKRVFWRDLHAVTGFWLSFFLIFMVLSGLPWSLVAGGVIDKIQTYTHTEMQTGLGWDGGGSRFIKSETVNDQTHEGWQTDHAQKIAGPAQSANGHAGRAALPLSRIMELADVESRLSKPYVVFFPVNPDGVYSVSSVQASKPQQAAYIHYDQYSGKVLKAVTWDDFSTSAKAIAMGVSLHEGRYYGWPNQLLNLVICLGLVGLVTAGLTMWWKRRPDGRLGAPPAPANARMGVGLVAVIVVLGLLMPLMGASVILILLGERLARRLRKAH